MAVSIYLALGLLAFIPLLTIALGARQLRRVPIGPAVAIPIDTTEMRDLPRWSLYAPLVADLEQAGFEAIGWLRLRATVAVGEPELGFALRHVGRPDVWALLEPADHVTPMLPVFVTLHSLLPEKRWLQSTNARGYGDLPACAGLVRNDVPVASHQELLRHHLALLEKWNIEPRALELHEFAAELREAMDRQLDEHVRSGRVVTSGGSMRCSLPAALTWSRRQRRDQPRFWRHIAKLNAGTAKPAVPLIEQVRSFERVELLLEFRPRAGACLAVMVVTGALALLSFAQLFDWQTSLAIGFTLLFHELGHFLAMRACGYRDPRIFFVPFLGGATSGRKPEATVSEEMIVLLAGPVPGLLLGALLGVLGPAVGSTGALVQGLANILIIINVANLLPLWPLDGGRIMYRLVAFRQPLLDASLRVGASATFLLGASRFEDSVLFILGVAVALGVPAGYRLAKLERHARALETPTCPGYPPRRALLMRVFQTLRDTLPPETPPGRVMIQARLLRDRLLQQPASAREALMWILGLAVAAIGALVVLLVLAAIRLLA